VRETGDSQFTRSGDVDIANQVVGSGDRDLLFVPVAQPWQLFAVEHS